MTELTIPFLGSERAAWQYPFGDLHGAGARLVMGSDWPVTSPDPLAAIHTAVNRTSYGEDGPAGSEPFLPEQSVDLTTAFAAYTVGSAWVNGRDRTDGAGMLLRGARRRPRRPRPRPLRRTARGDRRQPRRLDVGRRARGVPQAVAAPDVRTR